MKQRAVVKSLAVKSGKNIAVVETSRSSACDGCSKKDCGESCGMSNMFAVSRRGGSSKIMTASADNEIGAKIGDTVEIETDSKTVLSYAAIVFLFPIAMGLILYFLGTLISQSDIVPYIMSLAGFIAAFAVIYFTAERRSKNKTDIRIVNIISADSIENNKNNINEGYDEI